MVQWCQLSNFKVASLLDMFTQDGFVCAIRCCVISRWSTQHVVTHWLPMRFLSLGNAGVWPDLYSTWHILVSPKVAFVQAARVSFQKQLIMLQKENWKSAVIRGPLCAWAHLHPQTHKLAVAKSNTHPVSCTRLCPAKSRIIRAP